MPLDYYLALLQLHIAVVGVVIAGVVALVQLLNNAKPARNIKLLVSSKTLSAYASLLIGLLILLALGSWVSTFPQQATIILGGWSVGFFNNGLIGLLAVGLMLLSLAWFVEISLKTRTLLDTRLYLQTYVRQTSAAQVHRYLTIIYGDKSLRDETLFDPFQPIREYVKDSAFKYYDTGTADGLRQFGKLFDKALADSRRREQAGNKNFDPAEYVNLARYISESCEEFFRIFDKTASEKRKIDTVSLLHAKGTLLLQGNHDASHASLLPIARGLENLAKISHDDDEIIATIGRIRQLCDTFLDGHKKHAWEHIAGLFDEICLSVTRISEDYYLQKNNSLKTVPIIGYSTGKHQTVTAALVDFFCAYRDLGDRYTDAKPLSYFEAIESVIEVLFVRLGDITANGQQHIGFTMTYHELARELYKIYYIFGIDAIEHKKPELLGLALSNLRRIIKPAKNFKLDQERQELTNMIVGLAANGVIEFGDMAIKDDGRTIGSYTKETLDKHAASAQIAKAVKDLQTGKPNASLKKLIKSLSS